MKKNTNNRFSEFHAGRFLQQCLQASGHSVEWLARTTDSDIEAVETLFEMVNMDAELFVRLGRPMGTAFFSRVHEEIFGAEQSACCHG